MSEPTAGHGIPEEGGNSTVQPLSTTADMNGGDGASALAASTPTNATSPIDVNLADDAAKFVTGPLDILSQNSSADSVTKNNETTAMPTSQSSPPLERDFDAAAAAGATAPTVAAINGANAPAVVGDNISSNGLAAPIVNDPVVDKCVNNSDCVDAAAVNSSRNSPMNILAEIASVESSSGGDYLREQNVDDSGDGSTITYDSLAQNDIILSLKDSTYKAIMHQYFRKLEENTKTGIGRDEEKEKKIKEEVYNLLKNAGGRLLNFIDHRRPNLGFINLNEETARLRISNDISRRYESLNVWGMNVPSSPSTSKPTPSKKQVAPQVVFLSLKDDFYRTNIFSYFRELGSQKVDDEKEKRVKEDAYNFFKNSGCKLVQYNNWKKPDMGYYEVDEHYAQRKIANDICRRLDQRDRWDGVEGGEASTKSPASRNNTSGVIDLCKLAEIASGKEEGPKLLPTADNSNQDYEILPDSSRIYTHAPPTANVVHVPPKVEETETNLKDLHGNFGNTYSYLDVYTLEYLKSWLILHIEDPYPTEAQKARIIKDTGIGKSVLYNWFVSTRTRKWKPALNAIRAKYGHDKTAPLTSLMKVELADTIFPLRDSAEYLDGVFSNVGVTTDVAMEAKRRGALLPQPWEEHFDDKTRYFYYHNPETGSTQWKHPAFGSDEHNVPTVAAIQQSQRKQKPPKRLFNANDVKRNAKFNVGGNLFEVLCSFLPNSQESRIAQMAHASIRGDVSIPIARDVELFSLCIRFMRKGKVDLPGNVPQRVFLQELDYFGIPYQVNERNAVRNPTFYQPKQEKGGRREKCGNCPFCLREDCGECTMCLDMIKFGGPGNKRQRCLQRRCIGEGSQPATKARKQSKRPGKAISISSDAREEEASWEDEFAKIQAELNRKAEEAGKGGNTFGLTTAISKKPIRTSSRNAEKKRKRQAIETSDDDDDDTYSSGILQTVVAKGFAEYSKKSNAMGRKRLKATADAQKRYDEVQNKTEDEDKANSHVRGITARPSGKWQVQYYYCGSSRYIGIFQSKEDALAAYKMTREILGKEEREGLTRDQINNNINLAREAAFSGRGLKYDGPQADVDSLIQTSKKKEAPKTARQKRLSEKERKRVVAKDNPKDEEDDYVENAAKQYDGRYSLKRCSVMACDQVVVFGDRCIAHRPLCSKRGCQQLVHSDGKCKTHLMSSKRPTPASRAQTILYGVGYKFRKQFDGDLFEGEVIELLPGGGKDRRCKYLIDGFVEDLSIIDLRLLAQFEADNPVEFGKVGYRFRKQFNEGWYDGIVVKVLQRGSNGKDRRVHYSADDDFEDLSLDDLRALSALDLKACDECRSRKIFCDGTRPFCRNNFTIDQEVEHETEEVEPYPSEEDEEESRGRRPRSSGGDKRKAAAQKASLACEDINSFKPTENDVLLSLKDQKYKATMFQAFRKLGAKKENERDKEEERQMKSNVFDSFKQSGARFVKHVNYRKLDLGFVEADDEYARDKIYTDISRRMESRDRWAGENEDDDSDSPAQKPKYRPRISVKQIKDAESEDASSDESELEPFAIESDESKRRKVDDKCSIHDGTCTIFEALDVGPGWMVHVVPRKGGDHCPDKFFYSPTGDKFRSFISVRRHVQQTASQSPPTKKRKRAASPAESVDSNFHNDICECCGDLGELLCCSTCNLVYHLECTRPKLSELPEGEWSCAFCVAAGTGVDNSEPPLTKTEAIQGMKDIEFLKQRSLRKTKRMRIS